MLNDKVALITGGNRGIGRAITLKMAQQRANVAIVYSGNAEMAEETAMSAREYGVIAESFKCDVSDFTAVKETVAAVKARFGTIDILVNNAGVTADGLLLTMKEDAFDTVVDINLKGTFNMTRHIVPIFVKKRSGRIINISSIAGLTGNPGQVNYAASKAGVIGITKSAAKELASRNICCNAIAPGFIETGMIAGVNSHLMEMIPLGRVGLPEEVAALAVFLASDEAAYITGEVIRIDGGLAI